MHEHYTAVLHAVRDGVLVVDGDGRLRLANDEARRLLALSPDAEGRRVADLGLPPGMTDVLLSGRAATDELLMTRNRLLAVNNRPTDRDGGPPGSVATLRDSAELRELSGKAEAVGQRLQLLYDAGARIGTTLDVRRTAQELAEVAVPRFADFVTVDLAESVLHGEEPGPVPARGIELRRTVIHGTSADHPFYSQSAIFITPTSPLGQGLSRGQAVLVADLTTAQGCERDPGHVAEVVQYGVHSLISVPLRARGAVLGMANLWRTKHRDPFEEEDLSFASELTARAAVSIDNARRYTREHLMAVALQHSLLPQGLPEHSALDVAFRYLPAQAGVGGDWFDVLPLPGSRVALVVGDVVGHGLHAAATMGRLRTAVHSFSALDLPPDELLGHLDELVDRITREQSATDGETAATGATCLYAVYDPASGHCDLARAGHPPPALVRPDGTVTFLDVPAGPPLGVGGLPFETAGFRLPEGSRLALYTDGLVEDRRHGIDIRLGQLIEVLARADPDPEQACQAVLDALLPPQPSDDIALLVARTRMLDPGRVADWDVPPDPAAVAVIRRQAARQLARWGLNEVASTTELILDELVTNAIRHGRAPIRVRLLYDRGLTCEVSDASGTSPHLRSAATTDEGGRGLFLVAQLAERWGTRYTADGKIIWAEQSLGDAEPRPLVPLPEP